MSDKITANGMNWDDIILADKIEASQLTGLGQDVAIAIIVELHKRLRDSQSKRYNEKQPVKIKYDVCEDCESFFTTDVNCRCTYTTYKTIEIEFDCCPNCRNPLDG